MQTRIVPSSGPFRKKGDRKFNEKRFFIPEYLPIKKGGKTAFLRAYFPRFVCVRFTFCVFLCFCVNVVQVTFDFPSISSGTRYEYCVLNVYSSKTKSASRPLSSALSSLNCLMGRGSFRTSVRAHSRSALGWGSVLKGFCFVFCVLLFRLAGCRYRGRNCCLSVHFRQEGGWETR